MRDVIRSQLALRISPRLVDEVLTTHSEAKRNFLLGGLRLAEVEAGRFCEAAFRILEEFTSGAYTPLNSPMDAQAIIIRLANLAKASVPDSIRLHIPRALRLVYDIRNNRNAAHLADGIDPNLQDATLVVSILDWVLAELIRLFHNVSPEEAHALVDTIVARSAPTVQEFEGFLKVLNPALSAGDFVLLLLYQRSTRGATFVELNGWVGPKMKSNLRRTLSRLVNDRAYVHFDGSHYFITRSGEVSVETSGLLAV
jgi:hypothetical protein